MTPVFPSKEKEDEGRTLQLYIFSLSSQASSSQQDQRGHQLQHDHKGEKSMVSAGGSSQDEIEDESCKVDINGSSAKHWMSSKMRLMQKMMKKAAAANSRHGKWETRPSCSSQSNGLRVCSDCNTTTTPLWRSGPQGPKSLCNACGIRQRKARRAMAEAAAKCSPVENQNKEKKSRHEKMNKNCSKLTDNSSDSQSEGNVSFDSLSVSLSKSSSGFRRVFPRDEEEAAILLMELSCGLLHTC